MLEAPEDYGVAVYPRFGCHNQHTDSTDTGLNWCFLINLIFQVKLNRFSKKDIIDIVANASN